MSQDLRANTLVTKRIGPAIDIADGFTPITTLDITTADQATITDNSGTVIDISGGTWTWAAITGVDGMYDLTFKVSDVDEEGTLEVNISDVSLCLPILNRFSVLSEAAFDSKYLPDDFGLMKVNVAEWNKSAVSALNDIAVADLYNISPAEVNAEVVDALSTGILAELTGDPGATPTMGECMMLLYMTLRNLRITDKNTGDTKIHNSAGTEILKAIITDTVTTFTKAKFTIP